LGTGGNNILFLIKVKSLKDLLNSAPWAGIRKLFKPIRFLKCIIFSATIPCHRQTQFSQTKFPISQKRCLPRLSDIWQRVTVLYGVCMVRFYYRALYMVWQYASNSKLTRGIFSFSCFTWFYTNARIGIRWTIMRFLLTGIAHLPFSASSWTEHSWSFAHLYYGAFYSL